MASKISFDLNYFFTIFMVVFNATAINSNSMKNSVGPHAKDPIKDYIICRLCGADLADPRKIINHLSPEASVITNQTLFEQKGVEVQILKNPLGIQFRSITLTNTKCAAVHNWQYDFSWYPGFAWKPCVCEQCRAHHGWYFEPKGIASLDLSFASGKGFYMLKLNNLQSENCNCPIPDFCAKIVFQLIIMELSKEQLEFLNSCEEEFKDRYTDKDEEFMKVKVSDAKPPIVDSWPSGNQRSNNWNRNNQDRNWHDRDRNRQRDRYRERDNYRGGREREGDRDNRYGGKHHYQRSYRPY